jgi:general stress protein 26
MNSINQNQPEDNRRDLRGIEAKDKIRDLIRKSEVCFFCTVGASSESNGARPMSVLEVDDAGHLWFLSASDSHKNLEIAAHPRVHLYFQGSAHSDFLHLRGHARITRDPAKIRHLWQPLFKTWFTEGENDPRITAIEVAPDEGYYWDTKHGNFVAGIKMILGAMMGKTLDDSVEGTLRVGHAPVHSTITDQVPKDRPDNPNPTVDGTRFQGVPYPDDAEGIPDGESATGREEAEAARRDQEKIGTPAASP